MIELKVEYKERIDKYISANTEISRNDARLLIEENAVYVNGKVVMKPKFIVQEGQKIFIERVIDKEVNIEPEEMELNILYEDEHLCVLDKPSGQIVHPAPGHYSGTLVNGLLYHFKNNLSNENGLLRPGIVHRIDKDTSGLLIIAKNNEVHKLLAEMFAKHDVKRSYVAICDGVIEHSLLKLNLPIGRSVKDRQKMTVTNQNSKEAITYVHMLKTFYLDHLPKSLVKCELETGRTHQIRVHLEYIGNPIYGDPIYNKAVDEFGQRLHAYKIDFVHPITKERIILTSKPPKYFDVADYNFDELLSQN
ncbi:RluA family pseudouridine synthase [Mycoplasma corogypsi]|uniref:RluA family pseudouridine synthase n=1 Tax=Mycoplasma corogypsi TaxID=2106 RepID=UPI003872F897